MEAFFLDLSVCDRHHSVFHKWWIVFCFGDAEHAEKFRARFGDERFDPKDRGRGDSWATFAPSRAKARATAPPMAPPAP